jgi:hypothetical protein
MVIACGSEVRALGFEADGAREIDDMFCCAMPQSFYYMHSQVARISYCDLYCTGSGYIQQDIHGQKPLPSSSPYARFLDFIAPSIRQ